MGIDRTSEFGSIVSSMASTATHHHNSTDNTPSHGELRRRIGTFVNNLMSSSKKDGLSKEDHEFSRRFMSDSTDIFKGMRDDNLGKEALAQLKRKIGVLEEELQVVGALDNDLVDEHHLAIVTLLKQRLSSKERSLHSQANRGDHRRTRKNVMINKPDHQLQGQTMSEHELVEKYCLSPGQLQKLQESTHELLEQHSTFAKELSSVGEHINDIATLQRTLAEQLSWQDAMGEQLLDQAESTMGVVKKGNQILKKVSNDSTMRNMVLAVFLTFVLVLLLLDRFH